MAIARAFSPNTLTILCTYKIAEITRDGQVQLHILRETIREEVTAVLVSLSNLNLIGISRQNMPTVIDAVSRYAWKAAGVPSHEH